MELAVILKCYYDIVIVCVCSIRIIFNLVSTKYHLSGSMNTFWLTQITDVYEHKHRTQSYSRVRSNYSYLMACGSVTNCSIHTSTQANVTDM